MCGKTNQIISMSCVWGGLAYAWEVWISDVNQLSSVISGSLHGEYFIHL